MRSMKSVAVFMEDGAFALFFVPTQGMIWQLKSPAPGNLPSKAIEINYYIQGSAQGEGGGVGGSVLAQLELTDA